MKYFQYIAPAILGIVFAFGLFIVPDMIVVLSEKTSLILKIIWTTALFLISVAAVRKKEKTISAFTVTACVTLILLIAFGSAIRFAEHS